jgi:hypothetical protein
MCEDNFAPQFKYTIAVKTNGITTFYNDRWYLYTESNLSNAYSSHMYVDPPSGVNFTRNGLDYGTLTWAIPSDVDHVEYSVDDKNWIISNSTSANITALDAGSHTIKMRSYCA